MIYIPTIFFVRDDKLSHTLPQLYIDARPTIYPTFCTMQEMHSLTCFENIGHWPDQLEYCRREVWESLREEDKTEELCAFLGPNDRDLEVLPSKSALFPMKDIGDVSDQEFADALIPMTPDMLICMQDVATSGLSLSRLGKQYPHLPIHGQVSLARVYT